MKFLQHEFVLAEIVPRKQVWITAERLLSSHNELRGGFETRLVVPRHGVNNE